MASVESSAAGTVDNSKGKKWKKISRVVAIDTCAHGGFTRYFAASARSPAEEAFLKMNDLEDASRMGAHEGAPPRKPHPQ